MSESKEDKAARLREARLATKNYPEASDAARAMGVGEPTYLSHENGWRGFSNNASRYADFYRVNLEWLLTGKGPMKRKEPDNHSRQTVPAAPQQLEKENTQMFTSKELNLFSMPRDVPILGSVACGEDGLFELNGQTIDFAKRWPRLVGVRDLYAVYIDGSSMSPWREHGELAYISPHQKISIGDHVLVQLKDTPGQTGAAYIKKLERRTASELRLHQYNPNESFTLPMKKVKSIHRVVPWSELSA